MLLIANLARIGFDPQWQDGTYARAWTCPMCVPIRDLGQSYVYDLQMHRCMGGTIRV